MKNTKRKYNLKIDLSKFTSNKKKLSEVVTLVYNKVVTKFCLKFNYIGSKNFLEWSQIFFKGEKVINF